MILLPTRKHRLMTSLMCKTQTIFLILNIVQGVVYTIFVIRLLRCVWFSPISTTISMTVITIVVTWVSRRYPSYEILLSLFLLGGLNCHLVVIFDTLGEVCELFEFRSGSTRWWGSIDRNLDACAVHKILHILVCARIGIGAEWHRGDACANHRYWVVCWWKLVRLIVLGQGGRRLMGSFRMVSRCDELFWLGVLWISAL